MSYELILAAFPGDMDKASEQLSRYESSQDELGISEAVAVIKTEEDRMSLASPRPSPSSKQKRAKTR
jgi:hypothetical protein